MHPKLKAALMGLMTLMAADPSLAGAKSIKDSLGQIEAIIKDPEVEKFGANAGDTNLVDQVKQLRNDVDAHIKTLAGIQKLGLTIRGAGVEVPDGRQSRLSMLADKRAFRSDKNAADFAAAFCHDVYCQKGRRHELPESFIKHVAEIKAAGDANMDPTGTTTGGYLVMTDYRRELIRNVEAMGQVFTACRRVPLFTTGTTNWPKRTAGLTASATAFGTAITQSGVTLSLIPLTPYKWGVLSCIPNEFYRNQALLADIGQWLGVEMAYGFAYAFDNAVLNGDGTAGSGNIDGILHSSNITAVVAATGHSTAATLDATDISNVIGGLAVGYAADNARWYMHLTVQRKLRNLRSTVGSPLYDRGDAGEPNTIDGYPYTITSRSTTAANSTASTKYAVFGDLSLSHYFGMIGDIAVDTSDQALFLTDQTAVRGVAHVACAEADTSAVVTGKTAA
jgi:HK97 family phage major capsid protein